MIENKLTPEQSHIEWVKYKEKEGWVYGNEKDPVKKTHPCMVPYDKLLISDQTKDKLFQAVVCGIVGTNK